MIIVDVPRPEKCRGCRFMCLKTYNEHYTIAGRAMQVGHACILENEDQHLFEREDEIPDVRPDWCPPILGIRDDLAEKLTLSIAKSKAQFGKIEYFEIGLSPGGFET